MLSLRRNTFSYSAVPRSVQPVRWFHHKRGKAAAVSHNKRLEINLTAVFSVASGPSIGRSSARISSILRGSSGTSLWPFTFSFTPVPAVSVFHRALWDLEPRNHIILISKTYKPFLTINYFFSTNVGMRSIKRRTTEAYIHADFF